MELLNNRYNTSGCCVCWNKFKHGQKITKFGCDHVLCNECADIVWQRDGECPTCRVLIGSSVESVTHHITIEVEDSDDEDMDDVAGDVEPEVPVPEVYVPEVPAPGDWRFDDDVTVDDDDVAGDVVATTVSPTSLESHTSRIKKLVKELKKLADQAHDLIEDLAFDEEDADLIQAGDIWKTIRQIPERMYDHCDDADERIGDLEQDMEEDRIMAQSRLV